MSNYFPSFFGSKVLWFSIYLVLRFSGVWMWLQWSSTRPGVQQSGLQCSYLSWAVPLNHLPSTPPPRVLVPLPASNDELSVEKCVCSAQRWLARRVLEAASALAVLTLWWLRLLFRLAAKKKKKTHIFFSNVWSYAYLQVLLGYCRQ